MRRILAVCGVVALAAGSVVVAVWATRPPAPPPATEPVAVHVSDLPPAVYQHGRHRGEVVRVAYPLRLHPTADPLAWEFRPGSDSLPPTHRIHFAAPPAFPDRPPIVVVGTVEGITPDGIVRLNNVPGVVVIRAASVAP